MKKSLFYITLLILLSGCIARPVVEKQNREIHDQQSLLIKQKILETAKTGDWLVVRGYRSAGNLVANVTGIDLSHAGVINMETKQVIEAIGEGIIVTDLDVFIHRSYRLLIIRPRWWQQDNGQTAWENASKLKGKSYDFLGTIGFDSPKKYYCTELAVEIYKKWFKGNEKFPSVIKPGEMYLYGQVIYDSLPRDEM